MHDLLKVLVAIVLVLKLGLNLVASLVHRVQLINEIVTVCLRLSQLLLDLLMSDLQRAKLELKLVRLELYQLQVTLELIDFRLSFAVDLGEADDFSLVFLKLACCKLKILHQRLSLLLVDVEQLLGLLQLEIQVPFLALETIAGALDHVHFELHLNIFLLCLLYLIPYQVKLVLNLERPDFILFELASLDVELAPRRVQLFALL